MVKIKRVTKRVKIKPITGRVKIKLSTKITRGEDKDQPLYSKEINRKIKVRRALKSPVLSQVDLKALLANITTPQVRIDFGKKNLLKLSEIKKKSINFDITSQIGKHVFPPSLSVTKLQLLKKRDEVEGERSTASGFIPNHLALRPTPPKLSRKLRVSKRFLDLTKTRVSKNTHFATTIFSPDNRYVFNDTSYPWSTLGRVETPGGIASGVMIGPRHLLTVSHTIQWNSNGSAGWVKFTPMYFDGSAPFGAAWGTRVYYKKKVTGPTINSTEGKYDYVVVVLNTRMGNMTGWMGSRTYKDSWDGGKYWSHSGYPGDITSTQRPTYESSISLDGSFWDPQSHQRIWHKGDVWPGQSGGPYFGWWSGESFPRAVAVQSGQNSNENSASGGSDMVDLVIKARNQYP